MGPSVVLCKISWLLMPYKVYLMSHEVALLRTKGSSVFTQCAHTGRRPTKEAHFKFELRGDQIGIFSVFKPLEKILKIGLAV